MLKHVAYDIFQISVVRWEKARKTAPSHGGATKYRPDANVNCHNAAMVRVLPGAQLARWDRARKTSPPHGAASEFKPRRERVKQNNLINDIVAVVFNYLFPTLR